jgi:hydrogenase maturation protease
MGNITFDNSGIIKIIGFGNILMGDDGIGVRVIEELQKMAIFEDKKNIELIDGGTSGVDLVFMIQQAEKAVIIDAIDAGQGTGEIVVFTPVEIKAIKKGRKGLKSFSLHDIDLAEVFELLKTLNIPAKLIIIGIKPKTVGYSNRLSPEIENQIPGLISKVKEAVLLK